MTIKNFPATPLPFTTLKDWYIADVNGRDVAMVLGPKAGRAQQAAYLTHAANAYPKLVAALYDAYIALPSSRHNQERIQAIVALLHELGEEA